MPIFIVLGPTGSGKTSFIKALARNSESEDGGSASLRADTQSIMPYEVECDGRHLVLVDTPGLNNINLPDNEIFKSIAKWIENQCGPTSNVILGIIYLRSITENRMRESPYEHIEALCKQCNGVAVSQTCLITTMWDEVHCNGETDARNWESLLKDGFQKKDRLALVLKRLDKQRDSAWKIVRELVRTLNQMIFILVGPTGSGKTSFINLLEASEESGSACLRGGTCNVTPYPVERDGQRLVFVDTPGFDNLNLSNKEIFTLISQWTETRYELKAQIMIIYFQPITDNHMSVSLHEHIEMLRKQWKNMDIRPVCLVTTMWDEVRSTDSNKVKVQEDTLRNQFQKKNHRALVMRSDNRGPSAWKIVDALIRDCPEAIIASKLRAENPSDMIFVVMGPTGSGKTNLIHFLGTSGDSGSAALKGGTQGIVPHIVEHDGQTLILVDTPGLDNIKTPDETVFTLVTRWFEVNCQSDIKLGLIFLHRITDDRIKTSPQKCLEQFRKHCSGAIVYRICVVTTMWDEVDMAKAAAQEEYIKDEFQKTNIPILFKRFNNQCSSAQDIASELVGNDARRLLVELRERERQPTELSARNASYTKLRQLLSEQKEVLQGLLDDASTEARKQELRAELDAVNTRLGFTFEDMRERDTSLILRVIQWLARRVGVTASTPCISILKLKREGVVSV